MSKIDLPKTYDAKKVEDRIYSFWEESGFFNPDNLDSQGKPFTISMPPPNVTGILHLGHAFENALMDIEIRYQRMQGKKTLLVPGPDHAAVATQARVEDELKKQGIKNPRQKLGREKLLEKIREYAETSKSTILSQIKKMGTSCDWSRLAYTFDADRSKAVNEMFKRMYDDGLIYRGYRVINWSVKGQSTCSDDEIEYEPGKAALYTFRYSKDFPIPISTTRPETKLGDTAVAVHPDDERYKKYIGQKFIVDVGAKNLLVITIIADKNVDPNYGTGAVGVTPAHSQIDFEMYQNNKDIGLIQVIGTDGKMTESDGPQYQGLTVLKAREKFVGWLKDNDLFISEQETTHNVGASDRFGDVVEALPMDQWFIDVNKKIKGKGKSLKDLMREAVTTGHNSDKSQKINITPERFQKVYLGWIDNLRDWNISRQIWWGHRIPIWYKQVSSRGSEATVGISSIKDQKIKISDTSPGKDWIQDEDTLDTWFSSGVWTFSTLGWPKKTSDLKNFHPTSWMQLGYEILFFWLARMILMSTYALDEIPFKDVYIHGILRDKNGKKFSKSAGNGLDPIDEIKKYGADALRLALIKGVSAGNDSRFYEEKVEGARNFVNKLWNISRYVLAIVKKVKVVAKEPQAKTLADEWILRNLHQTISTVTESLDNYNFSYAAEKLQEFTRDDFADWYVEISKIELDKDEILLYVLENLLKLWHPFIPFVTEEIWQGFGNDRLLMVENWPISDNSFNQTNKKIAEDTKIFIDVIKSIRNLRSESKIEPVKLLKATIITKQNKELIDSQAKIIKKLARLKELNVAVSGGKPKNNIGVVTGGVEIYLDLSGIMNIEAEKKRLQSEIENIAGFIKKIGAKLENKEFTANAPKEVVKKEADKFQDQQNRLKKITDQLTNLK